MGYEWLTGRIFVLGGFQHTLNIDDLNFFRVHVGSFKPALALGVVKALAPVRAYVTPATRILIRTVHAVLVKVTWCLFRVLRECHQLLLGKEPVVGVLARWTFRTVHQIELVTWRGRLFMKRLGSVDRLKSVIRRREL